MSDIVRFSVSLEDDLLEQFDRYCKEQHLATRSEAVRQLIRDKLTAHAWESDAQDVAGTLTLVYDHHRQQLRDHLTALQHDHMEMVISTLHAHLTHDLCLEVIVLRPRRQIATDRVEAPGSEGDFEGRVGDGRGEAVGLGFRPVSDAILRASGSLGGKRTCLVALRAAELTLELSLKGLQYG